VRGLALVPSVIQEVVHFRGETTIASEESLIARPTATIPTYANMLTDLTTTDWPEREQRFDVIYGLQPQLTLAALPGSKCAVGEEDPSVCNSGRCQREEREC